MFTSFTSEQTSTGPVRVQGQCGRDCSSRAVPVTVVAAGAVAVAAAVAVAVAAGVVARGGVCPDQVGDARDQITGQVRFAIVASEESDKSRSLAGGGVV